MNDDQYSLRALREAEGLPPEPAPPENVRAYAEHGALWRELLETKERQGREEARLWEWRRRLVSATAQFEEDRYQDAWGVWWICHINVWLASAALSHLAPNWVAVTTFCVAMTVLLAKQPQQVPLGLCVDRPEERP